MAARNGLRRAAALLKQGSVASTVAAEEACMQRIKLFDISGACGGQRLLSTSARAALMGGSMRPPRMPGRRRSATHAHQTSTIPMHAF
jgi:hypothetical protein